MPYISPEARAHLKDHHPRDVGELTYELTHVILRYWNRDKLGRWKRYQTIAEIMGALICTALEFYRRVVAPYEDKKCRENGDVF